MICLVDVSRRVLWGFLEKYIRGPQAILSSSLRVVVGSGPLALAPGCRKRLPPHYAVFLTEWSSSPPKFFHPKP